MLKQVLTQGRSELKETCKFLISVYSKCKIHVLPLRDIYKFIKLIGGGYV